MILDLTSDSKIRLERNPSAPAPPPVTWLLDALVVGFEPAHAGYDRQRVGTVGSSVETGDELRFSAKDRWLTSAFFGMPEQNGLWSDWRGLLGKNTDSFRSA